MTAEEIKKWIQSEVYYEYYTFDGHIMSAWITPKNIDLVKPLINELPIIIEGDKFRLYRNLTQG